MGKSVVELEGEECELAKTNLDGLRSFSDMASERSSRMMR